MRIFLDARDLIDLVQDHGPCTLEQFPNQLDRNAHAVVLAPIVVFEAAAPLGEPSSDTRIP